jgi:LPXTG-motif cell wall-anchored protein
VKSSSASGGLPFTGGNAAPLVWLGIALVGVGAFFVARTRRARTQS